MPGKPGVSSFNMPTNLPYLCRIMQAQSQILRIQILAESGVKEYEADWLSEAKKVMRDATGKFAKKGAETPVDPTPRQSITTNAFATIQSWVDNLTPTEKKKLNNQFWLQVEPKKTALGDMIRKVFGPDSGKFTDDMVNLFTNFIKDPVGNIANTAKAATDYVKSHPGEVAEFLFWALLTYLLSEIAIAAISVNLAKTVVYARYSSGIVEEVAVPALKYNKMFSDNFGHLIKQLPSDLNKLSKSELDDVVRELDKMYIALNDELKATLTPNQLQKQQLITAAWNDSVTTIQEMLKEISRINHGV